MTKKRTTPHILTPRMASQAGQRTTIRLSLEEARELEIHTTVRRLKAVEPASMNGIVLEALNAWFVEHPIEKELRSAVEAVLGGGTR